MSPNTPPLQRLVTTTGYKPYAIYFRPLGGGMLTQWARALRRVDAFWRFTGRLAPLRYKVDGIGLAPLS